MDTNCCLKCMRELEAGRCPSCTDTVMTQDSRHLKPGTILKGKYLIGYSIGAGGFGITYIGRDLVLGMRIAVKEYYPSQFSVRNSTVSSDVTATAAAAVTASYWNSYERSKERFLNEVRTLARFEKDTGIVNVKDFFEANNTAYIVMEYIDGLTLKEYLEQNGNFDAGDIVTKMRPVMESLARVHEQGLLHRDISPDNIKMPTEGNLKLLDFGAARFVSADTYRTVTNMTKPGYAPEEQYRSGGELGPWSDIYALCATIYKCITGVTPSDAPQRLHNKTRHRRDIAAPSELGITINPALESAILKGMSVLQEERYQNISELLAAIDDSAKKESSQTPARSPRPLGPKKIFELDDSTVGSTKPSLALPQHLVELSGLTVAATESPFALSQNSAELSELTVAATESPFALSQNSAELSELTVAATESPFALSQNSAELSELTVAATESPYVLPKKPFESSEPTPNIASTKPPLPRKLFDSPQTSHGTPQPPLGTPQPPLGGTSQPPLSSPQPPHGSIPLFDALSSKRKGKSNQPHSSPQPPMSSSQPVNNSLPLFEGSASGGKRQSKKIIIISGAAVGFVLIVAIVLFMIAQMLTSPNTVAKNYYKAIIDEDYAKAFSYIAADSSEFVNEKSFTKYMQEQKTQVAFTDDFTVKIEGDGSTRDVSILNANSEKATSFILKKNDKKKFLFFDDYGVSIDDALISEYKLSVPEGFAVKLNGIDLKEPDVSDKGLDTYTITRIFPDKDYELLVTGHPFIEDYSNTFEIKSDDRAKTISISNMIPKQSVRDELKNKTEEDYKKIFLGVMERKRFDQMGVVCTSNATQQEDINDKIAAFASKIMPSSGPYYKSVNFKSFSDTSEGVVNDDMTYQCTMSVVYNCVKVITIKSPNPYLVDTVEDKNYSDQRETIKFFYVYENDTWVLYEIESLGTSY